MNETSFHIYKKFIGRLELFSSIRTLSEMIIRNNQYHKMSSIQFFDAIRYTRFSTSSIFASTVK